MKSYTREALYYFFACVFFLIFNEIYFHVYVFDILTNSSGDSSDYANLHDHLVYMKYIDIIKSDQASVVFGNNLGIAGIYYLLSSVTGVENYIVLSHYVNMTVYIGIQIYVYKLFRYMKISLLLSVFFVFNPAIFYYLSLINKDSFTILFVLMFTYYLLKKNYIIFILLVVFSVFVRIQLPFFAFILYYFIQPSKKSIPYKLLLVYLISSFMAVVVEISTSLISFDTMQTNMGIGITKIIRSLNKDYFIGSLLLNPVKMIQYFYDYFLAAKYFYSQDQFYFYRVKDMLNVFFLPLSLFSLILTLFIKKEIDFRIKIFLLIMASFFAVWLVNPTVNYRYIGIFIPYVIVSGIYAIMYIFWSDRRHA